MESFIHEVIRIGKFIIDSFIHIWPLLLITIPIAIIVSCSGINKYLKNIANSNTYLSIFLGTCIGAFSPFCSCSVIPVITSLLMAGVPLAPVMSFWIASPSMDPEIFFLSVASLGWGLAIARLVATFFISLSAGFITHFALKKGFVGKDYLNVYKKDHNNI